MTLKQILLSISATAILLSCSERKIEFDGGVYYGDMVNEIPNGYGTWTNGNDSYTGFWKDGKRNGHGVLQYGSYKYRGEFKDNKYDGIGVMAYGDSIVYEGNWKDGSRNGTGIVRDSMNRAITALWQGDSLISGVRKDEGGTYEGMFDTALMPYGEGIYRYGDMQFYEGTWKDDLQEGFGIQLAPDGWLRVGTWKKGHFKGEILNYTADRIYGIDIARYQHKAPISWKHLRIKHLGDISKKKITGKVDYPVSFIYIKCTEGETIQNKYYTEDYNNARRHGISCGAYHFFSIHSTPEKQAENFLKHLHLKEGDFPPVLDIEPTEREIKIMGGDKEMFRRIRIWLNIVEEAIGMRPILYINQMFVNNHMLYAPDLKKNYDVWIARYGEYKPDVHMIFWQLSPDGHVRGIKGDVDINVFNGYRKAYERYLMNNTVKK